MSVQSEFVYVFLGLTGPDDEIFDDIGERVSAMRHPGEDDMAFYERRYQERVMLLFVKGIFSEDPELNNFTVHVVLPLSRL